MGQVVRLSNGGAAFRAWAGRQRCLTVGQVMWVLRHLPEDAWLETDGLALTGIHCRLEGEPDVVQVQWFVED